MGARLQLLYDGALAGAKAARDVRPINEAAVLAALLLATAGSQLSASTTLAPSAARWTDAQPLIAADLDS